MPPPSPPCTGSESYAESSMSTAPGEKTTSEKASAGTAYALRVFVRIRPPLLREPRDDNMILGTSTDGRSTLSVVVDSTRSDDRRRRNGQTFAFDGVFDCSATQAEVFTGAVEPQVAACLQGFNSTVFCYGPSGTGKSYTCYGPSSSQTNWSPTKMEAFPSDAGIIPRAAHHLFGAIERGGALQHGKFLLRVSFLQLYRER